MVFDELPDEWPLIQQRTIAQLAAFGYENIVLLFLTTCMKEGTNWRQMVGVTN